MNTASQKETTMIEINVDRDYGPDETFEVETKDEALAMIKDLQKDPDVRRIWVDGAAHGEWLRS